ncbi:MAG: hypothetical protein HRU78_10985 [Gammaproteobacteria bacterium]|nr:MAG: hypothetical protein HRU78_10985 [Gammaproteobacteria bacterium]
MTLSGQIGYKIGKNVRIALPGFNLLNTHAINYYYTSRLPGEPAAGVSLPLRQEKNVYFYQSLSIAIGGGFYGTIYYFNG